MDPLPNAFRLEDTEEEQSSSSPPRNSDQIKNKANNSGDENPQKKTKNSDDENYYKMPLVWIDLEMTGLDIEVDRILEIACIITDGNLEKSVEGPDLVIRQSKECLDRMGDWCQNHHAASVQVSEFVKRHVGSNTRDTPLLAGNSVYVDFMFLKKYMPDLASLFSHVVVDVSTLKALCIRWYPSDKKKAPKKKKTHRALDIKESIMELKFYRQNIFKPKLKK